VAFLEGAYGLLNSLIKQGLVSGGRRDKITRSPQAVPQCHDTLILVALVQGGTVRQCWPTTVRG
jgi:hypothetical protein